MTNEINLWYNIYQLKVLLKKILRERGKFCLRRKEITDNFFSTETKNLKGQIVILDKIDYQRENTSDAIGVSKEEI
ncbi:MAG: hypothetical protein O2U61_03865, partial [Candidatus Bathyarchaeota archaeon]|nr:hypothetical protein [Candidatus Bathyarchaeota archaeon]